VTAAIVDREEDSDEEIADNGGWKFWEEENTEEGEIEEDIHPTSNNVC
jgi:hypothetical protein